MLKKENKRKESHARKLLPFSLLWSGNEEAFFLIAFTKINP